MLYSLLLAVAGLGSLCQGRILEGIPQNTVYDYIIVGSGAGGGPVAARLAQYGHKCLLIEAGDDQTATEEYINPGLNLKASEHNPMAWKYFVNHYSDLRQQARDTKMTWTTPYGEQYVGLNPLQGSTPRGIFYPRSGTFGGCTAHNAMFNVYPHESDWEFIERTTGDQSWAPSNMRRFYERLEHNDYLKSKPPGHGYNGWLGTTVFPMAATQKDPKLAAMVGGAVGNTRLSEAQVNKTSARDLNDDSPQRDYRTGLFSMPISVNQGKRAGPVDLMKQVLNDEKAGKLPGRGRLDIVFDTLVTRVLFTKGYKRSQPRANGVEYVRGKSLYRADPRAKAYGKLPPKYKLRAAREVILSGGSFNTPQILKLSGVGPKEELQRWGIPVVKDLPAVGTNLQDRYESTVVASAPEKFGTRFASAYLYKSSVAEGNIPDIFISPSVANFTGYFPGYSKTSTGDPTKFSWIVLKAHSRNHAGTVTLRSIDPRDMPIINFNSFDTGTNAHGEGDKDLQAVYEGVQFSRQAIKRANKAGAGYFKEAWPGAQAKTPAQTKDFIRREAWGHHASCTCPIGAKGDPRAVLDSEFRVQGVQNLRVVDASVFPKIPGFFIALPIYMIGEKAADTIDASTRYY